MTRAMAPCTQHRMTRSAACLPRAPLPRYISARGDSAADSNCLPPTHAQPHGGLHSLRYHSTLQSSSPAPPSTVHAESNPYSVERSPVSGSHGVHFSTEVERKELQRIAKVVLAPFLRATTVWQL